MQKTLAEIASVINGEVIGDAEVLICGISGLDEANTGDLSFVMSSRYFDQARQSQAAAFIVDRRLNFQDTRPVLKTENPTQALNQIIHAFWKNPQYILDGIHPTLVKGRGISFGLRVAVGAHCTFGDHVHLGDATTIYPGCFVGSGVKIGKHCVIYPNVTIMDGSIIGDRVCIHAGSVIGSDGFGYQQVEGRHEKIPQIGIVEIEDDVEIGSNVTIDRARFNKTLISKGTKIDNLVQIAHNVQLGENCIIVSQVGISGSTKIGSGTILAGQVGVGGHLTIGKNVLAEGQSGITKSLDDGERVMGFPARPHMEFKRMQANLSQLKVLRATVKDLETRLKTLEQHRDKHNDE